MNPLRRGIEKCCKITSTFVQKNIDFLQIYGEDINLLVQCFGPGIVFPLSFVFRIIATQLSDSGIYICMARNHLGSVLVQAELSVQGRQLYSQTCLACWRQW